MMDAETTKARQYSERLMGAAIDVVGAAQVELGQDWARNLKIVGLTILCRSISSFRAALFLIQQDQVMEARSRARGLYENLLWIGALRKRGADFVQDMVKDEAYNRRSLGELTFRLSQKHGADINSPDSLKLRGIIKDIGKQFPEMKKLNAKDTATGSAVEIAYVQYIMLSLDGGHCSVTALGRHLSREEITKNHTELVLSVKARASDLEGLSAIILSCRALLGVATGVNEILGFTTASPSLRATVTEFENMGWATQAN
jgi:tRNA threonylcarbamoyladenosine modification (KEOPS) complex  Pcc1 subunit